MDVALHEPLVRLIAQVVAIILVARLLGVVARRLGQPMVVAEVAAGIVLGPSLLGWLFPSTAGELFGPSSLEALSLVSHLGLVLFMFLIGLELDPRRLRGQGRKTAVISTVTLVVPFLLGIALALHLFPRLSTGYVPFSSFALFLGVALSITAFPVLARILSERRLLRSRVGVMTIACAAMNDVAAWCLLAFVLAAVRAKGIEAAVMTTVLAVGYVLVMFWVVRPLLQRVAARIETREGLAQNVVAGVVLLLFGSSWATEIIGVHALFGAFLLGAIVPRHGGMAQAMAEKLEDVVIVLLLPMFFAYSGVRTELGLLASGTEWLTCLLIVVTACAGKLVAGAVAARATGLPWRESGAIGILLNTRGLMELVVLNIGLDLGIISPTLFTMLVVMALFTMVIAKPVLDAVYPHAQLAKDLLASSEAEPEPAVPSLRGAPFSVLVCVAHDRSGPGLATLAAALAPGRTHALHLMRPPDRVSARIEQQIDDPRDGELRPMLERAEEIALDVKPLAFVSTEPAADICDVARVRGVDLVLLGWRKPILGRGMLGGTVDHVMKHASSDVALLVDRGLERVGRVLVATLGSSEDHASLALARRFRGAGADVVASREASVDSVIRDSSRGCDLIVVEAAAGPDAAILCERLARASTASVLIVRGRAAALRRTVEGALPATA